MDTELFELCKEVYERTGWERDDYNYGGRAEKYEHRYGSEAIYTSDYLLEKLPRFFHDGMLEITTRQGALRGGWMAGYSDEDGYMLDEPQEVAVTPLKALLKLTIALDDAGELALGDKV